MCTEEKQKHVSHLKTGEEGVYNVYPCIHPCLCYIAERKMFFCLVVLHFTDFLILRLHRNTVASSPKARSFHWPFFFLGKGRRIQADKTLPRYKCFEELCTLAQQCSSAAAAVLRTFLTKSSHWVGRTSSVASGIPAPQSPSPLCSVIPPHAESTSDFTH